MPRSANGPELVRELQERAARGMPARQVEEVGGWWLRYAPGCSWWVSTVLPHGDARPDELERRIAAAEEFYAARGAVTRFQITPPVCPQQLDARLAERGYLRCGSLSLQVAEAEQVSARAPARSPRVHLRDRPDRAWLQAWGAVQGQHGDVRAEEELLDRIALPCTYASAVLEEEVVAVGRAVVEAGWAGIFGMATLPRARGRGAARAVLAALADWAVAHAADQLYLQVERDNAAAVRLYERMGFSEVCEYHYRVSNGPAAPRSGSAAVAGDARPVRPDGS